jgi:ABC-type glycerol-3-phosphate transport system substrate-binding protein
MFGGPEMQNVEKRLTSTRREFLNATAKAGLSFAALSAISLGRADQLSAGESAVELTFWWWGEQEAPGLQKWVNETIAKYQSQHSNIRIKAVLQATESLMPGFTSAGVAKRGADIQYMWGGVSTMQYVWRGFVDPVSDLLGQDELGHISPGSLRETAYKGKVYGLPWYAFPFVLAYSKPAFQKAGLDPENPPRRWEDFLKAVDQLRSAGITPWGYGVKGLTGIGNFNSLFITQNLDLPVDILKAATGNVPFTDPRYAGYLSRVEELIKRRAFNDDVTSLEYFQSKNLLLSGQVAMVIAGEAEVSNFAQQLGVDKVGVMLPPIAGTGKLAGKMPNTAQQLLITSWSTHKKEAADLLRFFHTPERLKAMNELSGALPPDNRFNVTDLKLPQDRKIVQWMQTESATNYQNFWPPQMDRENLFLAVQSLFSGDLTATKAAQQVEDRLRQWRSANRDLVKTLSDWAAGAG